MQRYKDVVTDQEKMVKVVKDELEDVQQRRVQDLIDRDTAKNKWILAEENLGDEKDRNMKLRSENKRLEEDSVKVRLEND
ncbi:hypothetical protein Dimus_018230 [Dionaea muscipula]